MKEGENIFIGHVNYKLFLVKVHIFITFIYVSMLRICIFEHCLLVVITNYIIRKAAFDTRSIMFESVKGLPGRFLKPFLGDTLSMDESFT